VPDKDTAFSLEADIYAKAFRLKRKHFPTDKRQIPNLIRKAFKPHQQCDRLLIITAHGRIDGGQVIIAVSPNDTIAVSEILGKIEKGPTNDFITVLVLDCCLNGQDDLESWRHSIPPRCVIICSTSPGFKATTFDFATPFCVAVQKASGESLHDIVETLPYQDPSADSRRP